MQFGSLAIVKTTSRMQSNAVVSTPWGLLYESQRFALPDYPVTFDAKPWSSVEYVDADDGYRNAAFIEREPVSISTKNPGGIYFVRPDNSTTIGHPLVAVTAIGTIS